MKIYIFQSPIRIIKFRFLLQLLRLLTRTIDIAIAGSILFVLSREVGIRVAVTVGVGICTVESYLPLASSHGVILR